MRKRKGHKELYKYSRKWFFLQIPRSIRITGIVKFHCLPKLMKKPISNRMQAGKPHKKGRTKPNDIDDMQIEHKILSSSLAIIYRN